MIFTCTFYIHRPHACLTAYLLHLPTQYTLCVIQSPWYCIPRNHDRQFLHTSEVFPLQSSLTSISTRKSTQKHMYINELRPISICKSCGGQHTVGLGSNWSVYCLRYGQWRRPNDEPSHPVLSISIGRIQQ
jgi:hypothetical protein